MKGIRRLTRQPIAWIIGIGCCVGCQALNRTAQHGGRDLDTEGRSPRLTQAQEADVQFALGRSAEARGDLAGAMAAYAAAAQRDHSRADAYLRLAILHDRQGKCRESAELYRKALAAAPGHPEIYCDMGYSLALQRRWQEAEMNLRQAIILQPGLARAHNNLGLVLAHTNRAQEAVAEFRRGGNSVADAHNNVAFALSMDQKWDHARQHYQLALAAEPGSAVTRSRLEELDKLVAKLDSPAPPHARPAPGDPSIARASRSEQAARPSPTPGR
jgi:tetratricopeptide (TPR) repeat protein